MLDDEDIKMGEDHDEDNLVVDKKDDKNDRNKVIGIGKNSVIVSCSHKSSKKEVAIKIISKKDKKESEIEDIRDCIKMY